MDKASGESFVVMLVTIILSSLMTYLVVSCRHGGDADILERMDDIERRMDEIKEAQMELGDRIDAVGNEADEIEQSIYDMDNRVGELEDEMY